MRRDIVTILSSIRVFFGIFEFEDHLYNARQGCDIPIDRAERPWSRLAQHAACPALCAEHLLGALGAERLAWSGVSVG
jgi:hypothetical protein